MKSSFRFQFQATAIARAMEEQGTTATRPTETEGWGHDSGGDSRRGGFRRRFRTSGYSWGGGSTSLARARRAAARRERAMSINKGISFSGSASE